jgi:hypothetical protein
MLQQTVFSPLELPTFIKQNIIRYNCLQLTEYNNIRFKLTQVANSDWISV